MDLGLHNLLDRPRCLATHPVGGNFPSPKLFFSRFFFLSLFFFLGSSLDLPFESFPHVVVHGLDKEGRPSGGPAVRFPFYEHSNIPGVVFPYTQVPKDIRTGNVFSLRGTERGPPRKKFTNRSYRNHKIGVSIPCPLRLGAQHPTSDKTSCQEAPLLLFNALFSQNYAIFFSLCAHKM